MNNADLERYLSAQTSVRVVIDAAVKRQTKTQREIIEQCHEFIENMYGHNKKTPKYLGSLLREYMRGYFDSAVKGKTMFLYNVDGQLYKLGKSSQKNIVLPCWDTLPREKWDALGDCGASYWKDTFNIYFKA